MKCPFCKESCGNGHCPYYETTKNNELQIWVKGHYFIVVKVNEMDENYEIITCNYLNKHKTISRYELIKGQWDNIASLN